MQTRIYLFKTYILISVTVNQIFHWWTQITWNFVESYSLRAQCSVFTFYCSIFLLLYWIWYPSDLTFGMKIIHSKWVIATRMPIMRFYRFPHHFHCIQHDAVLYVNRYFWIWDKDMPLITKANNEKNVFIHTHRQFLISICMYCSVWTIILNDSCCYWVPQFNK